MTISTRTSYHNLASQPNSNTQVDVLDAARMYLSARDEGDALRMLNAGRHLELLEYFQRLNTGCDHDSTIPERGEGRRDS